MKIASGMVCFSLLLASSAATAQPASPPPARPWDRPPLPPGACGGGHSSPTIRCAFAPGNHELGCFYTDPCVGPFNRAAHELARIESGTAAGGEHLSRFPGDGAVIGYRFDPPLPAGTAVRLTFSIAMRTAASSAPTGPRGDVPLAGVEGARREPTQYVLDLVAPTLPAPGAPGASDAPTLVRERSLGPLRLGMTLAEVEALGLTTREHPSGQMGESVRMVGEYYVVLTGGRVSTIRLPLRQSGYGVRIGTTVLPPNASADAVTRALGHCGAPDMREGGTMIPCGPLTYVALAGPVAIVELGLGPIH